MAFDFTVIDSFVYAPVFSVQFEWLINKVEIEKMLVPVYMGEIAHYLIMIPLYKYFSSAGD